MINGFKITDLPRNERPRERIFRYGSKSLSNIELLALILRTGNKDENIMNFSARLVKLSGGINQLLNLSPHELLNINGIGKAKASQILALAELSKRFKSFESGDECKITSSQDVADIVMEQMKGLKQEVLKIIMLNTKNYIVTIKNIFIGTVNSSIVHPREIFKEAIRNSSSSIIICHNHPSGDPTPSKEDINATLRISKCGELLGIELLDHIIIGNGKYVSLKEKCLY